MEATLEQLEEHIYQMVFAGAKSIYNEVDTTQVAKFRSRIVTDTESRLNAQFGATLGLIDECYRLSSRDLTQAFLNSAEFLCYREDVSNSLAEGEQTFEQCFLNFLLRQFGTNEAFTRELEEIFLIELAAGLKS